jgi:hypothetical protein
MNAPNAKAVADLIHTEAQFRRDTFQGSSLIVLEPRLRARNSLLLFVANLFVFDCCVSPGRRTQNPAASLRARCERR